VDRIPDAEGRGACAPEHSLTSGEDAASPLRFAFPIPNFATIPINCHRRRPSVRHLAFAAGRV